MSNKKIEINDLKELGFKPNSEFHLFWQKDDVVYNVINKTVYLPKEGRTLQNIVYVDQLKKIMGFENKISKKEKYLINTDNWFVAPDGNQYKAVWGNIEILQDDILGVKTNRNSVNWYAKIGSEEKHVIIAGCQIHYACKCNNKPFTGKSKEWTVDAQNGYKEYEAQTRIYIAE